VAGVGPYDGEMSSASPVAVSEVTFTHEIDGAFVARFAELIRQLSSSAPAPTAEELCEIVGSDSSHLLVARDEDGVILGSMTLVVFRIPTGVRAWIEDVVVDEAARGRGVGAVLNARALEIAYGLGSTTVDLTSRPSREAANRLYQRLGFELRNTNVYRHNPAAGTDPVSEA
jgi:ribosomal protein S18 acetylase RimI-like enzyme